MGEAKKRKDQAAAWRSSLSVDEQKVADVAQRLWSIFPAQGACYRTSLFLRYHLSKAHGIDGQAMVGFVNDGTDDLYSSHAWFEFNGSKTDLGLSRPLHPELQKVGPLLIHGKVVRPGWPWSYHATRPPAGLTAVRNMLAHPETAAHMEAMEQLHLTMKATARSDELIRAYLDNAPDGLTYDVVARQVG